MCERTAECYRTNENITFGWAATIAGLFTWEVPELLRAYGVEVDESPLSPEEMTEQVSSILQHAQVLLLDTNVLSSLVKANRLDLLFSIFGDDLAVSPNVRRELEAGIQAGHRVLPPVVERIRQKRIKIVAPTKTEQQRFPDCLSSPKREKPTHCGLLSKDEVRHLIAELEEKAEMVVKYQTEIFEDATN